jgi:hypothetical protein
MTARTVDARQEELLREHLHRIRTADAIEPHLGSKRTTRSVSFQDGGALFDMTKRSYGSV